MSAEQPVPDLTHITRKGMAQLQAHGMAHPWDVLQSVAVTIAPAAPLAEVAKLLDSMQVLGRIMYGELPPCTVRLLRAVLLDRQRQHTAQLAQLESDLAAIDRLLDSPLLDRLASAEEEVERTRSPAPWFSGSHEPEAAPAAVPSAPERPRNAPGTAEAPTAKSALGARLFDDLLAGALRLRRETLHPLEGGDEEPA